MRRHTWRRAILVLLASGGMLFGFSCGGDIVRQSIKQGLSSYVAGGFSSTFSAAQLGDFILNTLQGGGTGLNTTNNAL